MRNLSYRRKVVVLLFLPLLYSFMFGGQDSSASKQTLPIQYNDRSQFSNNGPILINGNEGFVSGEYPGSGTENDPYVIENLVIDEVDDEVGIVIWETDVHFIIRNCIVSIDSILRKAIEFFKVLNGRVETCEVKGGGVELSQSNHCLVADCEIEAAEDEAVSIRYSTDCSVLGNTIEHCQTGIHLGRTNDSYIYNNVLNDNSVGIDLYTCTNISLVDNNLVNNGVRIGWIGHSLSGDDFANIDYNFQNNLVNGKPIGFFFNEQSEEIDCSQYSQLILLNCRNIRLENGNFSNASNGVQIFHSQNCSISGATIERNSDSGIDILYSPRTTITGCSVQENGIVGIVAEFSNNTIISDNQIIGNNVLGVGLRQSSLCIIFNNSIEENRIGINFYKSHNCTLVDNIIHNNTEYGVYLIEGSSFNRFYRNSFGWNSRHAGSYNIFSDFNYFDDGISQGNYWDDYSGFGSYRVYPGGIGSYGIDRYPSCIGICPFTIGVSVSVVAIVAIIMILVIQRRRKG